MVNLLYMFTKQKGLWQSAGIRVSGMYQLLGVQLHWLISV